MQSPYLRQFREVGWQMVVAMHQLRIISAAFCVQILVLVYIDIWLVLTLQLPILTAFLIV